MRSFYVVVMKSIPDLIDEMTDDLILVREQLTKFINYWNLEVQGDCKPALVDTTVPPSSNREAILLRFEL